VSLERGWGASRACGDAIGSMGPESIGAPDDCARGNATVPRSAWREEGREGVRRIMGSDPEELPAPPSGSFVGRRLELARLRRSVEAALLGRGARLWLVGIAGIGKTRLLDEIVCYAQLRNVPFLRADATSLAAGRDSLSAGGTRLLVVDPVSPDACAEVDADLQSFARSGGFAVAASRRFARSIGVPPDARIALPPLGAGDVRRLLSALAGRDAGAAEAAVALRETGGIPRRVERWAEASARRSGRGSRCTPGEGAAVWRSRS
jgi:hypothetical protein